MTLCSGIAAPEVAAPWVDWRLASEIEPFPRAVLQHRMGYKAPADHNQGDPLLWGDMTEVTPDLLRAHGIPLPEIVVAGTPCQAFSVAGARRGLEDARGNLTLAFVELLHAIVAARHDGKLAALWENVPGVLSDIGNAFGCFLGGLVGALDAIPAPSGGSWPREGMVEGPRARAAWGVLDAQWFDVAQRRERVFVVVDFGGAVDPAAVLLEPDSLRGNSPPSRETGQVSPTIPARSTGGGGLGTDFECDGGLIPAVAPTLLAQGNSSGGDRPPGTTVDTCESLIPIAFDTTQITSPANYSNPQPGDPCHPLAAGAHPPAIAQPWAVRRLMPLECARLQGFPDDWTQIPWRGKAIEDAPDGPQYKAYGNSMAVPVIRWIMDRMRISMAEAATAARHSPGSPPPARRSGGNMQWKG